MKSFVLGILKDTVGLAWSINRPPCFARRALILSVGCLRRELFWRNEARAAINVLETAHPKCRARYDDPLFP